MSNPIYKRVLIKISGEALAHNSKTDILDFDFMDKVVESVGKCLKAGVEVARVLSSLIQKRNTFYYFRGSIDIGDIVYADFHTLGNSSISNKTKNSTHHHIIVQYHSNNFQDCYEWMKSNNE